MRRAENADRSGPLRVPAGEDAPRALAPGDAGYPSGLADLEDAPVPLWIAGRGPLDGPAVAIVGSRAATRYGLDVARSLAARLAGAGVVVVSGLARGIDAAAHRGALEAGGRTIAVLASGVDRPTPPAHAPLARAIAGSGALASEYPPGSSAFASRFPARNRNSAGWARATVFVAAAERRGALTTAAHAARLGRALFAVPGDVDRATSRGTNRLLGRGARPCLDAADVLDALALAPGARRFDDGGVSAPAAGGADEARRRGARRRSRDARGERGARGPRARPRARRAAAARVDGRRRAPPRTALRARSARVSAKHALEWFATRALAASLGAGDWRSGLAKGEGLGALAHALGLRRRVARENLAAAFPERSAEERARILGEHYRELGRVVAEYARLPRLARSEPGEGFAGFNGYEHLESAARAGRGAILLSGHFSNFEWMAARIAQSFPVALIVRPMSNPRVDAWLAAQRRASGFELIDATIGAKAVFKALRDGRFVAMLADQDARRLGVFVPFLGRPASTAVGPARFALAHGSPIVTGFAIRDPDRRVRVEIEPPIVPEGSGDEAVLRLTREHVARLERRVRARPESWFWLHRRWKTRPAEAAAAMGE